jgi:hypothetical protein
MTQAVEDPVVTSSRREAVFAILFWALAMAYTVGYYYEFGYNRPADDVRFIFGIPDWVLWGVLVPWLACTIISSLFAKYVMQDADIGEEESSGEPSGGELPPATEGSHG